VNLICGDDPILLGRGKPDPTIFLVAGKMIGFETDLERGSVLVFEDGAPGVRAAKAAGMQCVWIPDGELVKVMGKDHDLSPGATLASMDEFVPEEWGLPPY
jgi:pseudouridine-5'-monophosphatase